MLIPFHASGGSVKVGVFYAGTIQRMSRLLISVFFRFYLYVVLSFEILYPFSRLLTYNSLELLNSKSYSTRYTIDKRQRSIDLPKAWDLILPASTFNDEFPEFWSPNHSPLLSASSTGPPTLPPADKSLDLLRLEIVKRLHAYPVVSVLLSRILNHSLSIQEAFLIYITAPHLGLWKITEKYGA